MSRETIGGKAKIVDQAKMLSEAIEKVKEQGYNPDAISIDPKKTMGVPKKAVVLVSGGMDSAVCLAMTLDQGYEVYPLTFEYGQRHIIEKKRAAMLIEHFRNAGGNIKPWKLFKLDLTQIGGSAITDKSLVVPEGEQEGIPTTYVPARNTIFLSVAMGYAESKGIHTIIHGANNIDYSGYRDCRPEYFEVMNDLMRVATTDCKISEEWVRGFIEGEGCFSNASYQTYTEGKKKYPVFSLQQSDLGVLQKLQKFFGAGNVNERKWKGKSNISKKRSWEFRLSYYDAYLVARLMEGKFNSEVREDKFIKWMEQFDDKHLNPKIAEKKLQDKGIKFPLEIKTPLMFLEKSLIIRLGEKIGVPWEKTWSCYNPQDSIVEHKPHKHKHIPKKVACGVCPACTLRLKGFREANVHDPIKYAIDDGNHCPNCRSINIKFTKSDLGADGGCLDCGWSI